VWELAIVEEENKKKKKLRTVQHFHTKELKSAIWHHSHGLVLNQVLSERTSLCALKGGRFVELSATTDMIALWARTVSLSTSTAPQWQCTRVFRTDNQYKRSLGSFEIYDEMMAVSGFSFVDFNISVLDPSGDCSIKHCFEDREAATASSCLTCMLSLSMKDRWTQAPIQKRFVCYLLNNGSLGFWDLDDGSLVKKVTSEQLTFALCMTSARTTTGDVFLLVGRLTRKGFRTHITVVDVLPLLYGDAAIASTSPSASMKSIQGCQLAKRLLFGHLKTVTALEVMNDGMVLSGALDGIIKLWSPDMKRVIRSFTQWISTSVIYDVRNLKSIGDGCFVAVGVDYPNIRVKNWSVRSALYGGAREVILKPNQSTKDLLILNSDTICTIDGNECQLWNLTYGSLKKVLRIDHTTTRSYDIEWSQDLGARHTDDGELQHLLAAGSNYSRLTYVWNVINSQVVMVIDHQLVADLYVDQAMIVLKNMEAMVGYHSYQKRLIRVKTNSTTRSSPVSEIFNGSFEGYDAVLNDTHENGPQTRHQLPLGFICWSFEMMPYAP